VDAAGIEVIPDDLARGIDTGRDDTLPERIVDGGVGAAVRIVEEAVGAGHVEIKTRRSGPCR